MSSSKNPTKQSPVIIKRTKEEWMQINPFLTEAEAQRLVNSPPVQFPEMLLKEFHDSPEI